MKIIDSNNIEVMRENIRTLAEHISEEGGDDPRVDTLVRLVGTSDLPGGKTLTALAGEHDQAINDIQGDVVNIIDIIGEEPIEQDTLTEAIAKNAQDISAINTNLGGIKIFNGYVSTSPSVTLPKGTYLFLIAKAQYSHSSLWVTDSYGCVPLSNSVNETLTRTDIDSDTIELTWSMATYARYVAFKLE